jgi:hypothetical protein
MDGGGGGSRTHVRETRIESFYVRILLILVSPFALWKKAAGAAASPVRIRTRTETLRVLPIYFKWHPDERRRSGHSAGRRCRWFRQRERSYRSQLLFTTLTSGARHATPAPLCSPSKPVRPQVFKDRGSQGSARSITGTDPVSIPKTSEAWPGQTVFPPPSASAATMARNSWGPLVRRREMTKNQPPRATTAPKEESGRSAG